ncbi:hypothetical protein ScPMuIL_017137 [Solemya velum]
MTVIALKEHPLFGSEQEYYKSAKLLDEEIVIVNLLNEKNERESGSAPSDEGVRAAKSMAISAEQNYQEQLEAGKSKRTGFIEVT